MASGHTGKRKVCLITHVTIAIVFLQVDNDDDEDDDDDSLGSVS